MFSVLFWVGTEGREDNVLIGVEGEHHLRQKEMFEIGQGLTTRSLRLAVCPFFSIWCNENHFYPFLSSLAQHSRDDLHQREGINQLDLSPNVTKAFIVKAK